MLYIFDWDGTLSNSLERIAMSMENAFIETGLPVPSLENRKSTVGLGLREAFLALEADLDDESLQCLIESYRHHYLAMDSKNPSPLFSGAIEVLESLKEQGHQLAVATGKSRTGLNRIFDHMKLQGFFDASRCADETRSKPHPLMLEEILTETAVAAQESLMVGDTDFDLLMARNAGVKAVGVTYGAHSIDRLRRAEPHSLIDRLEELLAW